jgi:hypothetical protein
MGVNESMLLIELLEKIKSMEMDTIDKTLEIDRIVGDV